MAQARIEYAQPGPHTACQITVPGLGALGLQLVHALEQTDEYVWSVQPTQLAATLQVIRSNRSQPATLWLSLQAALCAVGTL